MVIAALITYSDYQKKWGGQPLYDYEKLFFDKLQQYRHIWLKKATGLGIRVHASIHGLDLPEKNDLTGSQMCIVTGPRIDLVITFIDRMKKLLTDDGLVSFDSKETVIDLNGVHWSLSSSSLRCVVTRCVIYPVRWSWFFSTRRAARRQKCLRKIHRKIKSLEGYGFNS